MTQTTHTSVRVSQTIRATPERLFRAWTDPNELRHWWRMEDEGWAFARASLDVRVGGRYELAMSDPDGRVHVAVGVYRDVRPPTRLAFTWDWEDPEHRLGETLVTVDFTPASSGTTDVVITHERFTDSKRADSHERGWIQLLRLLDHLIEEPQT
jgi:uncharacterized protein YndB with AHSA1/START domain